MSRRSMVWMGLGIGALMATRSIVRKNRAYPLRGKVVLITGGSRGLGLLLARQLAAEGALLALCARDRAELERAKEELDAQGAQVFIASCDITQHDQVQRFVAEVRAHYGRIDVLINNAGVIEVGPDRIHDTGRL